MDRLKDLARSARRPSALRTLAGVIAMSAMLLALATASRTKDAQAADGSASVVTVNAASYVSPLAPGAIAAAFGTRLATRTEIADRLPLPTDLAGTSVRVIDSQNREQLAQLFFVAPGQVNYLIPQNLALGAAQVVITSGDGTISRGALQIANSSPAIFTFFSDGRGVPVALTTYDGTSYEPVANPDGSPRVVDPGAAWRPNYLLLFGTGFRHATDVRVRIGGIEVTPLYAGAQGSFAGLDQINLALPAPAPSGMVEITLSSGGRLSNPVQLRLPGEAAVPGLPFGTLTETDVQTIIGQAVAKAQQVGLPVTIAIVDREGNPLGIFKMNGARIDIKIGPTDLLTGKSMKPADYPDGLNEITLPLRRPDGSIIPGNPLLRDGAALAAVSKAGTAAFFSTFGNAFSTRSAGFIIQEHIPPGVSFTPSGPLFGVQFSQLPCTDIKMPALTLGLAGDPGGVPIYKNGVAMGGIGVEGDGFYSVDLDPSDNDQSLEEVIAVAATLGYEAPFGIRGDQILVDGVRLPFINAPQTGGQAASLSGAGTFLPGSAIRATPPSNFIPLTLGGIPGRYDPRFFPFRDSTAPGPVKLTANDVNTIITQAAQQAYRTRAAIRRPLGSPAEVNITVVDTNGVVLGLFSTFDAPIFGFDVSVQKARAAVLLTTSSAATLLRNLQPNLPILSPDGRLPFYDVTRGVVDFSRQRVPLNIGQYVDAAARDGVRLDGNITFSDRAIGFLARPFFPDDIDGTLNGPFSKPINIFSPFSNGLQISLAMPALVNFLAGLPTGNCAPGITPSIAGGIQIFAGSVALYKNGVFVGAIGISGDGIDQDDIIASTGSVGFEAPEALRADSFFVRSVRLPYVKFPRHPDL